MEKHLKEDTKQDAEVFKLIQHHNIPREEAIQKYMSGERVPTTPPVPTKESIMKPKKTLKQLKESMLKHLESVNEIYGRSPTHAGRGISQKIGTIRDESDKDPQYHKDEIEAIGKAIETNPEWASSMLPQMKARLEHHQKRLANLTPVKEEYSPNNPKIDLHNKSDGKYISSTNWSPTVKHAVDAYETKYPQHKGNIKGFISTK